MKKNVTSALLTSTFVFFATGCRSPEILPISGNTYLISAYSAFNGTSKKTLIIKKANEFAASKGKVAVAVSLEEKHPAAGFGGHFEYQFKLVDQNSPEANNTILTPRADVVIEKSENITADIHTKNQSEKQKDMYAELTKLDDLRKKGIITDNEFDVQKKKLLETN